MPFKNPSLSMMIELRKIGVLKQAAIQDGLASKLHEKLRVIN